MPYYISQLNSEPSDTKELFQIVNIDVRRQAFNTNKDIFTTLTLSSANPLWASFPTNSGYWWRRTQEGRILTFLKDHCPINVELTPISKHLWEGTSILPSDSRRHTAINEEYCLENYRLSSRNFDDYNGSRAESDEYCQEITAPGATPLDGRQLLPPTYTYGVQQLDIRTRNNEYISEYPEEVIDYFQSDETEVSYIDARNETPVRFDFNTYKRILSTAPNRPVWIETSRYDCYTATSIKISESNSFVYFNSDPESQNEMSKKILSGINALESKSKIRVAKISNLYRGSGTKYYPEISFITVPKEKLTNSNSVYIFPVLVEILLLNKSTLQEEPCPILCLATNANHRSVLRYQRSRDFIGLLLRSFTEEPLKFLDKEKWQQEKLEFYGEHISYWPKLAQIIPEDQIPSEVGSTLNQTSELTSKDLYSYQEYKVFSNSEIALEVKEVVKATESMKAKINDLEEQMHRNDADLQDYTEHLQNAHVRLERAKRTIDSYKSNIERVKNIETRLKSRKDGLNQPYLELLSKQIEKEKELEEYKEKNFNICSKEIQEYNQAYLNNYAKSNIIIEDIVYTKPNDSDQIEYISIKTNPKIASEAILLKKIQLKTVIFRTKEPVIINIDAGEKGLEKCNKVVGGPYRVSLTIDQHNIGSNDVVARISLTKASACFGYYKGSEARWWIHPHTAGMSASWSTYAEYSSTILNSSRDGCLGEALPLIHKGFKTSDFNIVIRSMYLWLSSAYSRDQWGQYYKHFPTLGEVNLSSSDEIVIPEEEVVLSEQSSIENAIESLDIALEEEPEEVSVQTDVEVTTTAHATTESEPDTVPVGLENPEQPEVELSEVSENFENTRPFAHFERRSYVEPGTIYLGAENRNRTSLTGTLNRVRISRPRTYRFGETISTPIEQVTPEEPEVVEETLDRIDNPSYVPLSSIVNIS